MKRISISSEVFIKGLTESLAEGHKVKIILTGRSMSPTFRHGKDYVVLEPAQAGNIQVNDVVLFDRGDQMCIHRVIKRDGDRLVIRGDGNSSKALEYATVDKVYGKVISGTMRSGKPFTIDSPQWKRQNERLEKYFHLWEFAHYVRNLLERYPLSLIVLAVCLYLSFCSQDTYAEPPFANFDKFVHVAMYFAISCVWWFEWLKSHRFGKKTILKGCFLCFIIPIIIGGLIEIAQGCFTATRVGDILDFYANAVGATAGIITTFAVTVPLLKFYRKKKKRQ